MAATANQIKPVSFTETDATFDVTVAQTETHQTTLLKYVRLNLPIFSRFTQKWPQHYYF